MSTKEELEKKSKSQLIDVILKLNDRVEKLERTSANIPLSKELEDIGSITDAATILTKQANAAREALFGLSADGMPFAKGGNLGIALNAATKDVDKFLGSARIGAKTFQQLSKSISSFTQITNATISGTTSLTSELTTQAATLNKLGLSLSDFSKNVDLAIFSFGLAQSEVKSLNMEIVKLSNEVNMLPADISRNFQMVAKNLAYDFQQIKEQFVGIQKLSAQTGVSVDTLVGKFGQPLDTIGGASGFAAQINSLLGSNVFSTTELLMMDEATRMQTVRDRINADSAITGALSQGGATRKFALQSVAAALGMSVDDARRFLETGDSDSVKNQVGQQLNQDFKGQKDAFRSGLDESELSRTLQDFVVEVRRTQLSSGAAMIMSNRQSNIEAMEQNRTGRGAQLRAMAASNLFADFGAGYSELAAAAASTQGAPVNEIMDLLSREQIFAGTGLPGEIKRSRVEAILKALASRDQGIRARGIQDLNSILQSTAGQSALGDMELSPTLVSAIGMAPQLTGGDRKLLNAVLMQRAGAAKIVQTSGAGAVIAGETAAAGGQAPTGNTRFSPSLQGVGAQAPTDSLITPATTTSFTTAVPPKSLPGSQAVEQLEGIKSVTVIKVGDTVLLNLINKVVDGKIDTIAPKQ